MRIHKNFYIVVLFLAVSFSCMLFLTTASPLYSVNPSPDGNTMFTVGKGLLHGLMPYKDLFDQRGPLIYLMNSVAALISYKSFLGIYIFESIAMFLDLFFIYKILNLKYSTKISIVSTFTIIPLIFASKFLIYGNLPEEYVLPLIFITIYMLTYRLPDNWEKYEYIILGLFMSISFWIKYTLSITWMAIYLVLIIYFIYCKFWKKLFMSILYGIIGFFPVTLFIMLLYACKHALYDLFYVYFYLNVTLYVNHGLVLSVKFFIILLLFLFIYIRVYNLSILSKYILITITSFNYLILCKIGFFIYYFEIITFMFILIPIVLSIIINKYRTLNIIIYIIPVICILGMFVTNKSFFNYSQLFHENNSYIDLMGKDNIPVFKEFSSIINKSSDKTLLNYGTLDSGFYTYSGLLPHDKYFVRNNMNYKRMFMKQDEYVKSNKYNFIIVRYLKFPLNTENVSIPYDVQKHISQKYKIVGTRNVLFEGKNEKYVLYQRRD